MKRFYAISLAMLIFAWNLSITLSTHFCGGKAVKSAFSIATADLDCGMVDMSICDNEDWDFNQIKATPCCENQHAFFKINDRYQNHDSIEIGSMPVFISKALSQYLIAYVQTFSSTQFLTYKQPLPKLAVSILYQVFRL